ncbi:type II secretion system secretin GspD [Pseudoduganella albidiflava]|uniref:Type II secretion system protein GspD n=1 Tax=Pseudoduganella albidiflava TaxID=321983 RepID=A0A411X523_9BURK|nr:type II secretion system secretin GspD [Pseudoduganella albidiflava]QBI04110.1 type II secretion system protein GspD [Pseudoduganella albidiflava]GGY24763.1 type II secretion system protein GspD [Pseudoduganella albidiflava]
MKTASKRQLPALRRLSAGALLCCVLSSSVGPAWAAPQDEAALNFVGADIESVIKAVGHYTNITFLIDPRVKGTITLVSEKSISKSQAFALLTSALRLQGYAIVSGDGFAKVVPEAEAKLQATPTIVTGQAAPKGDQVATQVFQLNHESAANLVGVLRPLISTNNTINANPGNNTLVITDYADNLKRLSKIIAAMDTPASADMDVIPVRHAIASDIASMINKLMEPGKGGDGGGQVSALADPRTNSLVLRAPSVARANLARSLIAKLDMPTSQSGNVHVVYLKNADATQLAETLRAVMSGETPVNTGASGNALNNGAMMQTGANNTIGQSGMSSQNSGPTNPLLSGNRTGTQQGTTGGTAGFIQADASTNTLIITAPETIYRNLRAVIDQLDVRRAQVYIEALIVEVSVDKASEFGVQWVGASGNSNSDYRIGGLQSFSSGGNNLVNVYNGDAAPSNGLTIGIFKQLAGGKLGLGAVAHTLETTGNGNILSTPNMITLDNEVATIRVGQNVPILTGQFTTTSGTNTNPFQTIDRKDVGLTLKVKPQISEGGTIKMAIYNESSSVDQSSLTTSSSGIILNTRVIENNVIADDGQIIVLGGLIEDTASDGVEKVRGLGDIPVLGNLFKYNTRARKKTNLMVFLRPVVIRNKEQSMSLAADRYDYMRASGADFTPSDTILLRQLGQPQLPALNNGVPVGSPTVAAPVPPAPVPAGAPGAAQPVPQTTRQQ